MHVYNLICCAHMCKKQFVPACCLAWVLADCLPGWFRAGLFGCLPDDSSPSRLPAWQQKAAMRSWRWIIALAAAKIVAYCWKCARRVSYLPVPCCYCSDCCWIGRNCKPLAARTCGDQDIGIACVFIILMKQLPLRKFTPFLGMLMLVWYMVHIMRALRFFII